MLNELQHAREEELSLRIRYRAAQETTKFGAPLYIEDRARRAWVDSYCKVRELERSYE